MEKLALATHPGADPAIAFVAIHKNYLHAVSQTIAVVVKFIAQLVAVIRCGMCNLTPGNLTATNRLFQEIGRSRVAKASY